MSEPIIGGPACSIKTGSWEDTTKLVRDRAYSLWEKAGRPMGREHEFWALASMEIEGEQDETVRLDRIKAR